MTIQISRRATERAPRRGRGAWRASYARETFAVIDSVEADGFDVAQQRPLPLVGGQSRTRIRRGSLYPRRQNEIWKELVSSVVCSGENARRFVRRRPTPSLALGGDQSAREKLCAAHIRDTLGIPLPGVSAPSAKIWRR